MAKILDMINTIQTQNSYELGLKGQELIESRLQKYGFEVYKRNFKKIGFEIDLIVYKYLAEKNLLVIQVVEVKTRRVRDMRNMSQELDLEQFGIASKWRRVRKVMSALPDDIKKYVQIPDCKHVMSFDLAIVMESRVGCLNMHTYIQNVNLLL
jgi:Holliday junction resolvase-like predicted endonuclease